MNDTEPTDTVQSAPPQTPESTTTSQSITSFPLPKGQQPITALLGVILAIPAPPFGLLFSLLALHKVRKNNLAGEKLANFGKLLSIISLIVFLYLGTSLFGFGHKNQAKEDLQPLMSNITQTGGEKICDNGDSGYSIDNRQPWYDVYYKISDNSNLSDQMTKAAKAINFDLALNTRFINSLQRTPDADGNLEMPLGDQKFSPTSSYLASERDGKKLRVTIHRDETVKLRCSKDWGTTTPAASGQAIINLQLSLPQREV